MSDDYLDIGMRRRGRILVCHGDDRPDLFAAWLSPLVAQFDRLHLLAEEYGVAADPQDGRGALTDVMDFCQRLGIEFDCDDWDGALISGVYRWGWMPIGTVRSATARGRRLLQGLHAHVDHGVRSTVLEELRQIPGLDEFVERTASDPRALREEIAHLRAALQDATDALVAAQRELAGHARDDRLGVDRA